MIRPKISASAAFPHSGGTSRAVLPLAAGAARRGGNARHSSRAARARAREIQFGREPKIRNRKLTLTRSAKNARRKKCALGAWAP